MKVKDIVSLIDFPDDVTVTIYSYDEWDVIYSGVEENIPEDILYKDVRGLEFPCKNNITINI